MQQKRDCILEKTNIDVENHFNSNLILCGSSIIFKVVSFFSFKNIVNNADFNIDVSTSCIYLLVHLFVLKQNS